MMPLPEAHGYLSHPGGRSFSAGLSVISQLIAQTNCRLPVIQLGSGLEAGGLLASAPVIEVSMSKDVSITVTCHVASIFRRLVSGGRNG
jgi:hypothetical protein